MPLYALDGISPRFEEEDSVWIAPDASLIGNIFLGRDVGVWFGSSLRGDNELISIGEGSNVQENTVMHTDMGFPLTIGRGCTIGDNSLIGMGAIVLNGAKIGNNCLVGAGALVTERKEFPDGSMILGSPAKVVRMLDDAAIEGLKASARGYVANARRFKSGMKRLD